MGKRKIVKENFDSLYNTYKLLASGGSFQKHNYTLCMNASKLVSLMQNFQEKIHLKDGRLRNVNISGHNFKKLPVCERCGKALEGMFNTYKDSLPEGEHRHGEKRFGVLGEVAEERGSRPDNFSKFLPSGGPSGASFWGGNMGLDRNDAAKTGGGTRGFLEAGGRDVGA